jgi:tripartite-type tricarboxylate transporter receptor subunit TctC
MDSTSRRRVLGALAAGSALGAAGLPRIAAAQAALDSVRIVTGFPPGGTSDLLCRRVADRLKGGYARSAVVDNKAGAGGQLAIEQMKIAASDGSVILQTPASMLMIYPHIYRKLAYDPVADLTPVSLGCTFDFGFAVGPAVPASVKSIPDFLGWCKANPAQANIGVPAPGSIPQFIVHRLARDSGAPLVSVPYRGSAPMVQELIGGQLTAGTTALGDFVEPHLAGRLRVIGVLGSRRSPALPFVPTFAEQGLKLDWEYWLGLFAPKGTPGGEVERVRAAAARALGRADVRERLQKIVFEPAPGDGRQLEQLVRDGTALWEPVVRASGWVPQ